MWMVIKANWFTDFIARDRQSFTERLDAVPPWAIEREADNKQTCSIRIEL